MSGRRRASGIFKLASWLEIPRPGERRSVGDRFKLTVASTAGVAVLAGATFVAAGAVADLHDPIPASHADSDGPGASLSGVTSTPPRNTGAPTSATPVSQRPVSGDSAGSMSPRPTTQLTGPRPSTTLGPGQATSNSRKPTSTRSTAPKPRSIPDRDVGVATTPTVSFAQTAGRIQRYGDSKSGIFSGMLINASSNTIAVYRLPNAAFDAKVRSMAGNATVVLRSAQRSRTQLLTLQNSVVAYADAKSIVIASIEMPYDGGALVVRVSSSVETARRVLAAKFGSAVRVGSPL